VKRAALVFPGGGAYAAASLRSLPAEHSFLEAAEALRRGYDLPSLRDLDAADEFDPRLHLLASNASPMTYLISMIHAQAALGEHDVVVMVGNSLGWFAALAASGALSFEDGFRLVQEVSLLQDDPAVGGTGGQVIYPLTRPDGHPDPELLAAVFDALETGDGEVHRSIELGPYAVLAGTETGVTRLLAELPGVAFGKRRYPLRLAMQTPVHGALAAPLATARDRLGDLFWRAPAIALVDGRGARWSPWSTDPVAIRDYTFAEYITTAYRFATSLRVALREWAPDLLVLPGPGTSLGTICAQIIVAEGYHGLRSRSDFEVAQHGDAPPVVSMAGA